MCCELLEPICYHTSKQQRSLSKPSIQQLVPVKPRPVVQHDAHVKLSSKHVGSFPPPGPPPAGHFSAWLTGGSVAPDCCGCGCGCGCWLRMGFNAFCVAEGHKMMEYGRVGSGHGRTKLSDVKRLKTSKRNSGMTQQLRVSNYSHAPKAKHCASCTARWSSRDQAGALEALLTPASGQVLRGHSRVR